MKMMKPILFLFALLTVAFSAQAQDPDITPIGQQFSGNPLQTAVPFMRISPDARSGAMGDVGIALSPDANAVFWNSAKLPFIDDQAAGISLSFTPWLSSLDVNDLYIVNAAAYYNLDDNQTISGMIKYFSLGDVQFRQTGLEDAVTENPQEFAVQLGYSTKLSDIAGLGVNMKYIHSDLAKGQTTGSGSQVEAGNAVAGDVNFYMDPNEAGNMDFAFGATITNLGTKIGYIQDSQNKDFLPTNLGLGTSFDFGIDEFNSLGLALDVNKLLVPTPENIFDDTWKDQSVAEALFGSFGDAPGGFSEEIKEFQASIGAEYNYNDQFFGRAGFFHEDADKGARQYATLGAGLKYNVANFNFAYLFATGQSQSPLDKTLRFSVDFDIN